MAWPLGAGTGGPKKICPLGRPACGRAAGGHAWAVTWAQTAENSPLVLPGGAGGAPGP